MGENWFEIDQTGIETVVFEWKVREKSMVCDLG
jgi:hypothetical protein